MKNKLIRLAFIASIVLGISLRAHAQWVRVSTGLATNIDVARLTTLDTDLFAGDPDRDSGIYRWNNTNETWTQVNNGLPSNGTGGGRYIIALDTNGSNLFVGTNAALFLSTNRGDNWTNLSSNNHVSDVRAIAIKGSNIFVSTQDSFYFSPNDGDSWATVNETYFPVEPYVRAIGVSGTDILVGVDGASIYRSTDNGETWSASTGIDSKQTVLSFTRTSQALFAQSTNGLLRSSDDGATWSMIVSAQSMSRYGGVVTYLISNNQIFAGTANSGVYLSTNGGTTWSPANQGLDNEEIDALAISGGYLYAGTYYGPGSLAAQQGVWRRPLSDFANAGVSQSASATFELSPNPTSGILSVHNAPAESHVSVMNMLGQSVIEIANQESADFTLDISHLAPGAYCVRLVSPDGSMTRMIVKE